jgi:hypothetical protein
VAVYVDRAIWERWDRLWCHLLADDADELHAFASRIGCERRRFQSKPRRPWVDHYDIDEPRRAKAVAAGAIELTRSEVCALIARKRNAAREDYANASASPTATRPPSSTSP